MDMNSALVLLSGGQDSTTCLAWAKNHFKRDLHTISFDYGQRHRVELDAARRISGIFDCDSHTVVDVQSLFQQVTASRLMEKESVIEAKHEKDGRLPASFVPFRNVFFMTAAAAVAYQKGIGNLVSGICQTDYSGYPDCRNEYAKAINTALTLASGKPLEIHTPLMWLTKKETVLLFAKEESLGMFLIGWEALALSHTCYEGLFPPCGVCPSCVLRANGFREAGIPDPLITRAKEEGRLPTSADPFSGAVE